MNPRRRWRTGDDSDRRLRVGTPPAVLAKRRGTGDGNMWHHVLHHLADRASLVSRDPASRRRRPPVDAWLADGHQLPPAVREPLVVHVHEAGWQTPELRATLDPTFLEVIERQSAASCTRADVVITPSEAAKRQVVDSYGIDPDAVHAVHHGVDAAVFRPECGDAGPLVAAAGGDPGRPYVLDVASLHPRKNLPALRDAMDELATDGYPHQLVVVGVAAPDRADSTEIQEAWLSPLPRSGRPVVAVAGPTDDELAVLMAGAAAFCLPSLMEGFGMPVLEAMACGTPVVVSDRGALPEVVGNAGLVVAPEAGEVAGALRRLLDDEALARELGERGHHRALRFSWEAAGEGWLAALRAAVGDTDGPPPRPVGTRAPDTLPGR